MSKITKITQGLDIPLQGGPQAKLVEAPKPNAYVIHPTDFHGITPKLKAKQGERVKAGSPLFFDKASPEVMFTSPVSGTVSAINRGEKRKLLEIVIEPDAQVEYESFTKGDPTSLSPEQVRQNIMLSGIWPSIRQRPYAVIANPNQSPKSIFVTAFDSSPLAPDYDFLIQGQEEAFKVGLAALRKLTTGKVHVGIHAEKTKSAAFTQAENVQVNRFSGPHPSGLAGIQIHHIDPINKGEVVWYLDALATATIGKLFMKGAYDATRVVAVTGSEVKEPRYVKGLYGTPIKNFIQGNLAEAKDYKPRIISGNALTGAKAMEANGIGYYHHQITVLPEGNHYEFFGWALPGFGKFSFSRTFFSWLSGNGKKYRLDTNFHGGHRAFVFSGQYEKVLPMDLMPVQLLKAVLIEDVELMEKLGIYEVAEEDMALCEYVCASKIEVQSILRKGLDMMKKEMS